MSGLTQQLAARADQLLADGKWHSYERTVRELMKVVPPGMALRRNERDRQAHLSKRGREAGRPRTKEKEKDELIAIGQRSIVREFLSNKMVFEVEPRKVVGPNIDYDRQLRLVGKHRSLTGDPYRLHRDRLEAENVKLRDQVKMLRDELVNLGREDLADKWAPES